MEEISRILAAKRRELDDIRSRIQTLEDDIKVLERAETLLSTDSVKNKPSGFATIFDLIDDFCEKKNLTKDELAELMGISKNNYNNWKRGTRPSMKVMAKVSNTMDELSGHEYRAEETMRLFKMLGGEDCVMNT